MNKYTGDLLFVLKAQIIQDDIQRDNGHRQSEDGRRYNESNKMRMQTSWACNEIGDDLYFSRHTKKEKWKKVIICCLCYGLKDFPPPSNEA